MNKCSNCGAEYEGEFCPNCGVSRSQEKVCPNCGALVKSNVNFCNHCGHTISANNTANGNRGTYAKLASILPCVSIFGLLLFSVLLWAFYSAPILNFLGAKLNVYKVLTENVSEFESVAKSLIIIGATSVAYSLLVVCFALIGKTSNVKVGKIYLPTLLSLIGSVFYLTVFVIACVMTAEINKTGLSADSCCGLLIAFSLIFALATVLAFVLDCQLMRKNDDYNEARSKLHKSATNVTKHHDQSESKQRKEHVKKQPKARIKEDGAKEIALSATAPDKKLKCLISAFLKWNKCVWLVEFIGLIALMNYWTILTDTLQGFTSRQETLIYTLLNHGDALAKTALIAVLVLGAVALSLVIVIAVTTPRMLKTDKPIDRKKKLSRVYLISEITFIVFATLFVATIILFVISRGVAFVEFSLVTLIPCFGSLASFILGIKLNKIFCFKRSKKSAGEATPTADLDAFCDGCVAYCKYVKQQRSNKRKDDGNCD